MDYLKVRDLIKLRSENKLKIKIHSKYGEVILRIPIFRE
jgi:formylmethanofuran dehydrogenase subunit D